MEKKITPQERWQKKNGYISKAYKLHKTDVEAFAQACKQANVAQSAQITKMMRGFVKQQNTHND